MSVNCITEKTLFVSDVFPNNIKKTLKLFCQIYVVLKHVFNIFLVEVCRQILINPKQFVCLHLIKYTK